MMLRLLPVFVLLSLLFPAVGVAQVSLTGRVLDNENNEPIIGATVFTEDRTAGANTDDEGNFEIFYNGQFPVNVLVTYIGYDTARITFETERAANIRMEPTGTTIATIDIVGQRISEQQQEDPRTMERMDGIAIRETPAANFYDALGNMRGVDITAAAMGFKIINTRGFNSTVPVRSLQLIDGADNASPGLNMSLGNLVGASELDLQSVDIVQGAGSVTYGPGAFNGVIAMTTRDPFIHQGLSVQLKMGERSMFDGAFRFAHAFNNRAGRPVVAFKLNAALMSAYDWEATNDNPTPQSIRGMDNYGGYDAVNRYGDENLRSTQNNYSTSLGDRRNFPGLDIYHRTGYWERDLVDYNTRSLKLNAALHWRITDSLTLQYRYNVGSGTTVFQGDNRYALKDYVAQQHTVELRAPKWYVQVYTNGEDAGKSYDAVFTALLLQNQRTSEYWWNTNYREQYRFLAQQSGILTGQPGYDNTPADALEPFLSQNPDVLRWLHTQARSYADGQTYDLTGQLLGQARLEPGTSEFTQQFQQIISNPSFNSGGSRFISFSRFYHANAEYHFTPSWLDIKVGGRFRYFTPDTRGTVFADTLVYTSDSASFTRQNIDIYEAGAHLLLERRLMRDRIILSLGTRLDKSQNFDPVVSPAFSAVFKVKQRHYFRLNVTNAVRNPTIQDQYLNYNVGRARLRGNLDGVDSVVALDTYLQVIETALLSPVDSLRRISFNIAPIRPEIARTLELGYKANPWNPLFVDLTFWYSWYEHFIGYNLVSPAPSAGSVEAIPTPLRVSANANEQVTTIGFTAGLNYYFKRFYSLSGNYTFTELASAANDPIIPAYNTPRHKFNISIGARDMMYDWGKLKIRHWGFNVNLRWVDGFIFEGSPQFTGFVDTYWTVDAQISYAVPKWWNATFKLGASNLLDRKYIQVFGGPYVGRMAYFQVGLDLK